MATKDEKLQELETFIMPVIEKTKNDRDIAQNVFIEKDLEYQNTLAKYHVKIAEIDAYYEAQKKIVELQALKEPEIK